MEHEDQKTDIPTFVHRLIRSGRPC